MKNTRNSYIYISLAIIQLLLLLLAFPGVFFHPANTIFSHSGDGLKNYFTLYSYLKEPIGAGGIFKYNSFAWPYGDYVYYTDNSPLFSLPFKWFCIHIADLSGYTLPAFNFFILSNFIACSILAYFIFKQTIGKNFLSLLLAVVLPWSNFQVPRIWAGHYNLSASCIILAAIALVIYWHHNRENSIKKVFIALSMIGLMVLSFLLHGYYIAITAVFLAGMLLFLGIKCFRSAFGKQCIIAAFTIPAAALGTALTLLRVTDKYYSLRQENAMGYDHSDQKTNFLLLFTRYDFNSLGFPVASTMPRGIETMYYLGNIGLFSFLAIWTGAIFSTPFRQKVFNIQKTFFEDPIKRAIFMGGLLSLVISFGEQYTSNRDVLKIITPIPWLNQLDTNTLLVVLLSCALIVYLFILIFSKGARAKLQMTKNDFFRHPLKKLFLLFCVALMVFLFIGRYTVEITNVVNPFFYLHFITKRVEQFRCLSRFSWAFFWAFYVWIMYTVVQLYQASTQRTKKIIVMLIVLVGCIDLCNFVTEMKKRTENNNPFAKEQLSIFNRLKIDCKQYKAILPFPYYIVGSEDYPHTIDDNNAWSLFTMQLSLYSHLPLMSCKMSRTPPSYSIALLDFVSNDRISPELHQKLDHQPILIIANKTLLNDPAQMDLCASTDRQVTRNYYQNANNFIARHHLMPIDSLGDVYFYQWTLHD